MSQPAQEQDAPYPFISPIIAGVVFLGGCVGTGVRYALSPLPVLGASSQTTPGSFHLGTFIANMIACFCYAALVSYLAQAPWIPARRRELVSRSCGMGICGGLSTLSALALEVFLSLHAGSVFGALLYIVLTFAGGFVLALLGVRLATWMAEHHRDLDDVHARSHAADEGRR